ncbi:MAG: hypothetical protein MK172_06105 [Verrucomicrobiales bacterium]|nr:hypothetical protein [Verrucomicrobiales bacterium]
MKRLLCVLGLAAVLVGCGDSGLGEWTGLTDLAWQGDAQLQFELGEMYSLGVAEDDVEVVQWYGKAGDQGLADAKAMLKKLGIE